MSRLDSFIRRLEAQRACLELAAGMILDVPGPVLELGLGNGRTYDHLRTILCEREIFVFDRCITSHHECIPDNAHMVLGEFHETLPHALARIGAPAALVHTDIGTGTGDIEWTEKISAFVARMVQAATAPEAVVVSDLSLNLSGWAAVGLPPGIQPERYFVYRRP